MDFLAQQRIGIESCLTSNIQTSTVASLADHPLKTFLEHGVLASLNTDDPAVQGVDIIHEYHVAAPAAGLSREQIRRAQINGLEIAFLSDGEKRALREKKWPRRKIALLMLTPSLRLRFNAIGRRNATSQARHSVARCFADSMPSSINSII